ncbi:MAG: DinB family protein [Ignavibacteria bacterium]|nr:DinB family protein [Ignavibacteria bacterium]
MNHSQNIGLLLQSIDEGYFKKAWHGPNLRGSIRGLTAKEAAWRPGKNRHNIWEIVVHCAYWKYIVRRRILGEKRGSFPIKGSNWFKRPDELSKEAWQQDVALLDDMHSMMRETIAQLKSSDLDEAAHGSKQTNRYIISGVAMHDVYHAGQVQLIKRLM